jgi:hypothetical protein
LIDAAEGCGIFSVRRFGNIQDDTQFDLVGFDGPFPKALEVWTFSTARGEADQCNEQHCGKNSVFHKQDQRRWI